MTVNGDPNRRRYIVRSAARLFREKGYDRATIRGLAEAVELQSGSLFHYFASKEEILFAVIEDALGQTTTQLRETIVARNSTRQNLRLLIRCELEAVCGETADGMYVAAFEWRKLSDTRQRRLIELHDEYEAFWHQTLAQADAAGELAIDPFLLRRFLQGALSWTSTWFRAEGALSLDDLTEAALALALRPAALAPKPPPT